MEVCSKGGEKSARSALVPSRKEIMKKRGLDAFTVWSVSEC